MQAWPTLKSCFWRGCGKPHDTSRKCRCTDTDLNSAPPKWIAFGNRHNFQKLWTLSDVSMLTLTDDKTLNHHNAHLTVTLQRCSANATVFMTLTNRVLPFKTWRFLYVQLCVECFVLISEQTATFALYVINWVGFIAMVESVYCAVRTDSLYKADYVCSLNG